MPLGRCRLCHLRFESAFAVESLDAMILAIGDVDPPIGITGKQPAPGSASVPA